MTRWTEEARRRNAEQLRKRWADPAYRERMAKSHTPQRRARQSALLKELRADPEFLAKQLNGLRDPSDAEFRKERSRKACRARCPYTHKAAMMRLHVRRPDLAEMRAELTSKRMRELLADPVEREKLANQIRTAQPKGVKASIRSRRGGDVPDGFDELYRTLRPKVGAKEAMRLVKAEAARVRP